MPTGPRYSFVIPAYRDSDGLRRHFAYFARQTAEIELIVVDDASPDDLEAVCAAAVLPDHVKLRYSRNAENLGPGPSRNAGLAQVTGDRTVFLDADDLLAESFFGYANLAPLETGADFVLFKYHLAPDLAGRASYRMHRIDNLFFSNLHASAFPARLFTLADLPSAVRTVNFPWNKIYRTEFLKRSGVHFPDLRMHEDIAPNWQAFLRARRFGVLAWAPPLIHHFVAPGGDRATNYVGHHRLAAFETLADVAAEVARHPYAERLRPELIAFADNLITWILGAVRRPRGPDTAQLLGDYEAAAETFYDRIGWPRGTDPEATAMGEIQTEAAP